MTSELHIIAAVIFALALIHTFSAKSFEVLAKKYPNYAGLFHLLAEVEISFGLWALVLIAFIVAVAGGSDAMHYLLSRSYTEPLFVFVIMVVAASRPVLTLIQHIIQSIALVIPGHHTLTSIWLSLALVPMLGSLISEPAAMTVAAMILAPMLFNQNIPEKLKYAALGILFVNISIGGILTSYAAPPVLMVAKTWQWDSTFMATTFGWRALVAVCINATALCYFLSKYRTQFELGVVTLRPHVPFAIKLVHILFLAAIVLYAHQPQYFLGIFLLFLGFSHLYKQHQSPLIVKEALLVAFFLAGLVILGGMQQWWLQPMVSDLEPLQLFFGATALTAITDNAALTYLGSLVTGLSDEAKYMLMAGAVTGGGLTIIANAPNPAGATLLKHGFAHGSIHPGALLLGALPPTIVAGLLFLV